MILWTKWYRIPKIVFPEVCASGWTPAASVPGRRCTHAPFGGRHPGARCALWSCPEADFFLTKKTGFGGLNGLNVCELHLESLETALVSGGTIPAWISLPRLSRFSKTSDMSPNWALRLSCSSVIFSSSSRWVVYGLSMGCLWVVFFECLE